MTQRNYSDSELDRMRSAIHDLLFDGDYERIKDPDGMVEEKLRAHMLNGIGPEDLEAEIEARQQRRIAHRKAAVEAMGG